MKTHNDRPSNHKGAPAQPNRSASDPIRLGASGDKEAKPANASTKPSGSGDAPKSAVDARAGGAAGAEERQPARGHREEVHMSLPGTDTLKARWKQQVGAAKVAWGKLTDDELLQTEGHAQKLSGLVEERYALTRDEAARQVKAFFDAHPPAD